jgi:hypothetical protein
MNILDKIDMILIERRNIPIPDSVEMYKKGNKTFYIDIHESYDGWIAVDFKTEDVIAKGRDRRMVGKQLIAIGYKWKPKK